MNNASPNRRRLGIYWNLAVLEQARAAYVADLDALDDPPVGFARWVEDALRAHNARTPERRAALAAELGDLSPGSGGPRPIWMDDQTIDAVHQGLRDDRRAGHIRSASDYAAEAVRLATAAARERAGGKLPPAPARLPTRPTR